MSRPGITFEQVESAVAALAARGENVTYVSVRDEAGGGCYTTIGKHLQALRERDAAPPSMTVDTPQEVAATFNSLLGQLWNKAQAVAAQDVETLRRAANARVELMQTELDQVTKRLDTTLDELDKTAEKLAQISERISPLEQANARLQGENDAMAKQLGTLNASFESQLDTLKQLIEQSTGKGGNANGQRKKE